MVAERGDVLRFVRRLAGFLLPFAGLMAINAFIDPFRFYIFPDPEAPAFANEDRYQSPALMKHLDYDTLLVGSSQSSNFTRAMFPNGIKFLNVAARGLTIKPLLQTLDSGLRGGQPKTVLIELHQGTFRSGVNDVHGVYPDYLYNESLATPFKHLLTLDYLVDYAKYRRQAGPVDGLFSWWSKKSEESAKTYFRAWSFRCDKAWVADTRPGTLDWADEFAGIKERVRRHPEIRFIGYLTPRNLYSFYRTGTEGEVNIELSFRQGVKKNFAGISNFELYDFGALPGLADDLTGFIDEGHFTPKGNELIARSIFSGREKIDFDAWRPVETMRDAISRLNMSAVPQCQTDKKT